MATYEFFEDMPVWQKSRELACMIYKNAFAGNWKSDYALKNQIQRSVISISSNIAEGFERGSKQEFIQFLYIAKGSCGELRSQLYIAKDVGYLNKEKFDILHNSTLEVSKQISGFLEYLKSAEFKGHKYQAKMKK